jgi:hypothetical protein
MNVDREQGVGIEGPPWPSRQGGDDSLADSSSALANETAYAAPAASCPPSAALRTVTYFASGELATGATSPPAPDAEALRVAARIAQQNKILKPFMAGLEARGITPSADLADGLITYRNRTIKQNGAAIRTLHKALPALDAVGIAYAVFKGPVQQLAVSGDMLDRPVSDIDLLVADQDFDRATDVISSIGFQVVGECASDWWRVYLGEHSLAPNERGLVAIDLHHRTQQPGCPSPRHPEAMLQNLVKVRMSDLQVPTLGPVSMALLCSISICKAFIHREACGAHVLDLARMTRAATPERRAEIAKAASDQGLVNTYGMALQVVAAFLDQPLGPGVRPMVAPQALLTMALTPDDPDFEWPKRRWLLWRMMDGHVWSSRIINFAREVAWASAAELSLRRHLARQGHLKTA